MKWTETQMLCQCRRIPSPTCVSGIPLYCPLYRNILCLINLLLATCLRNAIRFLLGEIGPWVISLYLSILTLVGHASARAQQRRSNRWVVVRIEKQCISRMHSLLILPPSLKGCHWPPSIYGCTARRPQDTKVVREGEVGNEKYQSRTRVRGLHQSPRPAAKMNNLQ